MNTKQETLPQSAIIIESPASVKDGEPVLVKAIEDDDLILGKGLGAMAKIAREGAVPEQAVVQEHIEEPVQKEVVPDENKSDFEIPVEVKVGPKIVDAIKVGGKGEQPLVDKKSNPIGEVEQERGKAYRLASNEQTTDYFGRLHLFLEAKKKIVLLMSKEEKY